MNDPGTPARSKEPLLCSSCGAPTDGQSTLCSKCAGEHSPKPAAETPPPAPPAPDDGAGKKGAVCAWLKRHERALQHWSHFARNCAEIIALVLVGLWSLEKFKEMDEPGLKPRLSADMEIAWTEVPQEPDMCEAKVTLKLENSSKQRITITTMRMNGWLSAIPGQDHPPFISEEELRQGEYFFHRTLPNTYLLGPLSPGAKVDDEFLFQFKKDPPRRVFWEATFKTDPNLDQDPLAADWDFVCNFKKKQ